MYFIDFSYTNKISDIHPFEKVLVSLGFLLLSLTSNNLLMPVLVLLFTMVLILSVGFPIKGLIGLFLVSKGFLILGILPLMLGVYKVPLSKDISYIYSVFINERYIIVLLETGLKQGLITLFKALSCIFSLFFVILTTPFMDIMYLLKRARVPGLLLELLVLTYHYMFMMYKIIYNTIQSQKARLGYNGYINSLRTFSKLIYSLFYNLYKGMHGIEEVLESRVYSGKIMLLNNRSYNFSMMRVTVIGMILMFWIFVRNYM